MPLAGLATLTAVSASLPRPVRQLSEGYVPPEQVVRPPLTPERYVVMLSFDVAEGREGLVDVLGLLEGLARGVRLVDSFRTGQVHEM